MISRTLQTVVGKRLSGKRASIIIGARQVGKTTLIRSIIQDREHLFLDGDDPAVRDLLNTPNTEQIKSIIGNHELVFIDEAQRIENIGLTVKIIVDQLTDVQVIISGSSALEINDQFFEPLTGRKWEYHLFPISWEELVQQFGFVTAMQQLDLRLVYGMYPEVINHPGEEVQVLRELVNSYLYKDILALSGIRKPSMLEKLLKALAYQMGNEVSYNELANLIGVDKNTVSTYIDLLCQTFVLFKLPSFSRNLRNELKRAQKIYFYDVGVRNALINNFDEVGLRSDTGAIWENFLLSERLKRISYHEQSAEMFFWRTVDQKEIDYIEVIGKKVFAFEFKWNAKAKVKKHKSFLKNYNAPLGVITRENFSSFAMTKNR